MVWSATWLEGCCQTLEHTCIALSAFAQVRESSHTIDNRSTYTCISKVKLVVVIGERPPTDAANILHRLRYATCPSSHFCGADPYDISHFPTTPYHIPRHYQKIILRSTDLHQTTPIQPALTTKNNRKNDSLHRVLDTSPAIHKPLHILAHNLATPLNRLIRALRPRRPKPALRHREPGARSLRAPLRLPVRRERSQAARRRDEEAQRPARGDSAAQRGSGDEGMV